MNNKTELKIQHQIKKNKNKLNKLVDKKEDLLNHEVQNLSKKIDKQIINYMKLGYHQI